MPLRREQDTLREKLPVNIHRLLPARNRVLLKNETCPRRAAWSARHPVTVEIVGSNPIGGAQCGVIAQRKRHPV